ncbi:MAG: ABC transporter permease [Anaerolineaceae bacterium]|mgnify:CR=1 FL=1|nr:ABC transporter permease [Anaerolineaceae bacterium]
MIAFYNHFAFEFKTGLRNSNNLMMNYLFPLGFYAMMGLVMTRIFPGFDQVLIPAMVVFATMASSLLGLPGPQVELREAGVFRSYKINGVPAISILIIPVLTTIFHTLIVSSIIALSARPLFGGVAPLHIVPFILITLLAAFNFSAISALIGVISTNSRATVLWSQLIFLPSMLIGGMMVPISMLPEGIQPLTALLPSSHAMQAFLGLAYGQPTSFNTTVSIAVLAISLLLAFGLAIHLFNWDTKNKTRRGHPLMALLVLIPYIVSTFLV